MVYTQVLCFQSEVTYSDSLYFCLCVCVLCYLCRRAVKCICDCVCVQIVRLALDSNYQWLHHNDTARAETDKIVASPNK